MKMNQTLNALKRPSVLYKRVVRVVKYRIFALYGLRDVSRHAAVPLPARASAPLDADLTYVG